jgi:hypothetical protein
MLPVYRIVRIGCRRSDRCAVRGAGVVRAIEVTIDAREVESMDQTGWFDLDGELEMA